MLACATGLPGRPLVGMVAGERATKEGVETTTGLMDRTGTWNGGRRTSMPLCRSHLGCPGHQIALAANSLNRANRGMELYGGVLRRAVHAPCTKFVQDRTKAA